MTFDHCLLRTASREFVTALGEDVLREGLLDTPDRMARAWAELTGGYQLSPKAVLKVFDNDGRYDEMVVIRDIDFVSICEHHMLPFQGVAHVGYLPGGKIVGLSKLARLVDVYARRLQVQERLTKQITDALDTHLAGKGSACVVEARHMCLACRGARKPNAVMVTSSLTGAFKTDLATRAEFLQFCKGG